MRDLAQSSKLRRHRSTADFPFIALPEAAKILAMSLDAFLSAHAQVQVFEAGAPIVVEGAQAEAAYVLREGHAAVFRKRANGSEALLARLGPGDIVGEMALLRYDFYTLSVRAESPVVAYVIPPDLLHDQMRQTPPLVRAILDMLLDRVNETNEALIDIESLPGS